MPAIFVKPASALLTADGGTDGYVSVADATPFWTGAKVWLKSSLVDGKQYTITEVDGSWIGLQIVHAPYGGAVYTRTDVSEYLLADSARIYSEGQIVPAELTNLRKL
jgi:hypothetical protein